MKPEFANCRSCSAEIYWTVTRGNRRIPVDVVPVATGNIWFADDGVAEFVSKYNEPPDGAQRYVSHFSTCPESKEWQTKNAKPVQKGLL